jgi:hypothetical protein
MLTGIPFLMYGCLIDLCLCLNGWGMNEGPTAFATLHKLSTNATLCHISAF